MWKEILASFCLQFGAGCYSHTLDTGYGWPLGTYRRLANVLEHPPVTVSLERNRLYVGKILEEQSATLRVGSYFITVTLSGVVAYFPDLWVRVCRQPYWSYIPNPQRGECVKTTYSGYIIAVRPVAALPDADFTLKPGGSPKWRRWRNKRVQEFLSTARP